MLKISYPPSTIKDTNQKTDSPSKKHCVTTEKGTTPYSFFPIKSTDYSPPISTTTVSGPTTRERLNTMRSISPPSSSWLSQRASPQQTNDDLKVRSTTPTPHHVQEQQQSKSSPLNRYEASKCNSPSSHQQQLSQSNRSSPILPVSKFSSTSTNNGCSKVGPNDNNDHHHHQDHNNKAQTSPRVERLPPPSVAYHRYGHPPSPLTPPSPTIYNNGHILSPPLRRTQTSPFNDIHNNAINENGDINHTAYLERYNNRRNREDTYAMEKHHSLIGYRHLHEINQDHYHHHRRYHHGYQQQKERYTRRVTTRSRSPIIMTPSPTKYDVTEDGATTEDDINTKTPTVFTRHATPPPHLPKGRSPSPTPTKRPTEEDFENTSFFKLNDTRYPTPKSITSRIHRPLTSPTSSSPTSTHRISQQKFHSSHHQYTHHEELARSKIPPISIFTSSRQHHQLSPPTKLTPGGRLYDTLPPSPPPRPQQCTDCCCMKPQQQRPGLSQSAAATTPLPGQFLRYPSHHNHHPVIPPQPSGLPHPLPPSAAAIQFKHPYYHHNFYARPFYYGKLELFDTFRVIQMNCTNPIYFIFQR